MDITERYEAIYATVAAAAKNAGRGSDSVTVVAVSKQQPESRIDALLGLGQRVFGENRVQEAKTHWQHRRPLYDDLELHLIGALQSNKAREAVRLFDVIETVGSDKLARALADEVKKQNRHPRFFIQVNTGLEPQKSGIAPTEAVAFSRFCQAEFGLNIKGLMCIPPLGAEPAKHFALLHQLATEADLPMLSMGMSADFAEAIACGATHIRLGSALFGDRP